MTTRSLIVLLAALSAAPLLAQSRKSDRTPVTVEDVYTVTFPKKVGGPEDSVVETNTLRVNITTQKVEHEKVIYSVTVADYPENFEQVKAEKILCGVRDGMKGKDGLLKLDDAIKLDGVDGRDIKIEAGANVIRAKIFLRKNRLFQIVVIGPKDRIEGSEPVAFLKSFDWMK